MAERPQDSQERRVPSHGSRGTLPGLWEHVIAFDVEEARLVMSAQSLLDFDSDLDLPDHAIPMHACSAQDYSIQPMMQGSLSEAHQQTGLSEATRLFGLTGNDQTVAVIDSGIAWDHVALGGGFGAGYRVVGGWDFTDENDANPYDDPPAGFHGTHIAGVIGANDGQNFGVARDVDLVALRVVDDRGSSKLEWVEKALQWVHENRNAFENPITTVNVSIGAGWNSDQIPSSAQFEDELKQLYDDGIVVVASAGNGFQQYKTPGLTYPAASQYVIPGASVDSDGSLSDFSQRHARAIAAPGDDIRSTVPDHVLGKNGIVNDWSEASGTSMAAPYVAGAAVLVRQAMEMSGVTDINMDKIYDHLQQSADSVWDPNTSQSYHRLNLERAIDSLIPDDDIGDNLPNGRSLEVRDQTISSWINTVGDDDVYRFTAQHDGQMVAEIQSQHLEHVRWVVYRDGAEYLSGDGKLAEWDVKAGHEFALRLSDDMAIGTYDVKLDWQPGASEAEDSGEASRTTPIQLGQVAQVEREAQSNELYILRASHDGLMTIIAESSQSHAGSLQVLRQGQPPMTESSWQNGQLRSDVLVEAGDELTVRMPSQDGWRGQLKLTNLVEQSGKTIHVHGLPGADQFEVDLSNQIRLVVNSTSYQFPLSSISLVELNGDTDGDSVKILGSTLAEKIEMRPSNLQLESNALKVTGVDIEEVRFDGGGGPDRAFLYDADTNDTLYSRASESELVGVGYRYVVSNTNRSFFHATSGGQDIAYLYDSQGDDTLAVRPQFTSIRGDTYFNYVTGFDRVNAYATIGGNDTAELYDSPGDDRFNTSGDAASIVGTNFFSYTRFFEHVSAFATAGGSDQATLYANSQSAFLVGTDFVSYEENGQSRIARGFERTETLLSPAASKSNPLTLHSIEAQASPSLDSDAEVEMSNRADPSVSLASTLHSQFAVPAMDAVSLAVDEPGRWQKLADQIDTETQTGTSAGQKSADGYDWPAAAVQSGSSAAQLLAMAMASFDESESSEQMADHLLLTDPELESRILAKLFQRRS